ncbi:MAG: hypothetical protein IJF49_09155 [Clostridia bacterium]|nr:hypothetical protein [Clostridia bacterium]
MTEIMPVPRKLRITVLPAGSGFAAIFAGLALKRQPRIWFANSAAAAAAVAEGAAAAIAAAATIVAEEDDQDEDDQPSAGIVIEEIAEAVIHRSVLL